MVRHMGLDQTAPLRPCPPGAARHLMQQLKCALGGAGVGLAETKIAIDHTDHGEAREVMPLGDNLGADDDLSLAGFD